MTNMKDWNIIDSRILPLKSGEFRSRLRLEHVKKEGMDVYGIANSFGKEEQVGILMDYPIRSPFMVYYKGGFTSTSDKYLVELIDGMMYINTTIDKIGIKKMTEFLLSFHCRTKDKKAVLTFEELFPAVTAYAKAYKDKVPELLYTTIVLYSKDTMLTSKEKQAYSLQVRRAKMSKLSAELIHDAAVTAIKVTNPQLRVTRPRVLENVEDNKVRTVRTLNNHIREDTANMIDKANTKRIFKTETSLKKYTQFLELPEGLSAREQTMTLNISASTLTEFKNKKYEQ